MTGFFGPDSPYLQHPLLTAERTVDEVDRLLGFVGSDVDDVLDMGCGFGRHSIEFARRGFRVVGVDPSPSMIAEASARTIGAGFDIEYVEAAGQYFERPDSCDLAICLFTTLGQLGAEPDAGRSNDPDELVERLVVALRPGGTLVVEVPDRARTAAGLIPHEVFGTTTVERHYVEHPATVHERFCTPTATFDLAYRLYSREELCDLIEGFGLVIVDVFDDGLVTPPHNFITVVARNEQPKETS